ncbi:MAG: MATE family efflux transporter [Bacteroidota bacterium]
MNFLQRLRNGLADKDIGELLRGGAFAMGFRLLGIAMSYGFTLAISRNYGVDAWGTFALSFALLQIMGKLGRLGLERAATRFIAEFVAKDQQHALGRWYWRSLGYVVLANGVFALALFWGAPWIAKGLFQQAGAAVYVRLIAFSLVPFSVLLMNAWSLKGLKRTSAYSFLENTSLFLFGLLFLWVWRMHPNQLEIPVLAIGSSVGITCLISFALWARYGSVRWADSEDSHSVKETFRVSLPLLVAGSMFMIMSWTDTLMLGYFQGEAEVGAYNIATKIARFSTLFITSIDSIFMPKISAFYLKRDWKGLERITYQSTRIIFFTSMPLIVLLFLFPEFLLSIFDPDLGKAPVVASLLVLAAAKFINAICGNVGSILQMTGKQMTLQGIVFFAMLLNIGLNLLLIPYLGITGAAWSSFAGTVFFNLAGVIMVKRYFGVRASYAQFLFSRNR